MIGDRVNSGEAKEAAVEEVSFEHEFHFEVGMPINLLDDEDFEHHNGIVGFTADFAWDAENKGFAQKVYEVFTYGEFGRCFS